MVVLGSRYIVIEDLTCCEKMVAPPLFRSTSLLPEELLWIPQSGTILFNR